MNLPALPTKLVLPAVLLAALTILIADYLTGPDVRFTILYVGPIGLAAWQRRIQFALVLSVVMPLFRLFFAYRWNGQTTGYDLAANTLIQWLTLVGITSLIAHIHSLQKRVHILEGVLPICSYCKKIRGSGQQWEQIETYISKKSTAQFTHTYCPECLHQHFPDYCEPNRPAR